MQQYMPRYQLYILSQLSIVTVVVALSLTSIVWLLQALRFVDYIVNRGVSIGTFLELTSMLLPSLLVMILPVASLAATLFVYARLMQDSELVVLLSAGLSRLQLARPLILLGSGIVTLLLLLSIYLLPKAYGDFKDMQTFLRDNYASLLLQEEVFNSPVDGLTVYVQERSKDGVLKGILVHDNRNRAQPITMMAKRAVITQTPAGPRFILEQGNRQEMKDGKLTLLYFARYPLDVTFYTEKSAERPRKPNEMGITELLGDDNPELSKEDRARRLAELHNRVTWPFMALGLMLVGLGVLLRGEFNRRGQPKRVVLAVIFGLMPLILAIVLQNAAANMAALGAGMYLNALGSIGIGLLLLSDWRPPAVVQELMDARRIGRRPAV
jgi:lipopolysaccharide export system permease protein